MLMIKNGDYMRNLLKNWRHILCSNEQTKKKNYCRLCFDPLGDRKHAFHHKHSTNKIQRIYTKTATTTTKKRIARTSIHERHHAKIVFSLGIRSSFPLYVYSSAIAFSTILFPFYFSISNKTDDVCSLNFVLHAWLDAFNFCFIV